VSLTGTLPCARRDLCVPNRKKHRTSYPEPIFEPTCLTLERNDGGAKFKPDCVAWREREGRRREPVLQANLLEQVALLVLLFVE
jgi:hypothetical protein